MGWRQAHNRQAHKRPRGSDRDAVVDALGSAFADGQLTADEHEAKVAEALAVRNVGGLVRVLDDVQIPPGHAASNVVRVAQPKPVDAGTPTPRRASLVLAGVGVTLAALIGLTVVVGISANSSDDEPEAMQTEQAFRALVEDVQDELGSTEVLAVQAYDTWAAVLVYTGDGSGRYDRYSYDPGDRDPLDKQHGQGGTVAADDPRPVDLAEVDVDRLMQRLAEAREDLGVTGDLDVTVTVASGDFHDTQLRFEAEARAPERHEPIPPHVQIRVGNGYQERGVLVTDLSGSEVLFRQAHETPQ